ncbi:Ribosomal RNA adenine methylase transferase [Ophiocordyceps sinensis CO18]|uniref:Mitochondrial transcription factor 1 n=1 Tax=Ophiocordyceps sinensis (strain Co18 / CGMCC 3.14243) TaxID=911162 RepID=T5AP89_OPHSC|nr:Ribosomal RNA adenine methylase transferase [Ophiocordyceps sinensis CO18]
MDTRRVNIVSSELCDAIIKNLGASLERHRGCDLVDLNPGVGLWSQTLHDVLQPRKHILMDLDAELYKPFLANLLDKDNVELVPKSGIVWKDLLEMMHTHLPGQTERDKRDVPTRNDTLLLTANLSMFPKKAFHGFESVSTMVLYQLLSSIRTSSLFQKYGLVRMLVWINDEDKKRTIPRSLPRRKRSAFEAEMSCEWVHEVAGADDPENRCTLRDWWINTESEYKVMERMAAQGLELPSKRMTRAYAECKARPELMGQRLAGVHPPTLDRPFKGELEQLRRAEQRGSSNEATSKRLKVLLAREKVVEGEALQYREYLEQFINVSRLPPPSPTEFEAADAQWNERIGNLKKNTRVEFNSVKDNYILFRQNPPAMLWDRRALEPINVFATDFLPNAPTALLDIQPKAMRPIFRQYGPASSRSGDMSDIMLRFWYQHTLLTMPKAMDGLWGGFGDLASQCPSLTDPDRGGSPLTGHGVMVSRAMNEEQWAEVVQAWMDWPFRPTFVQMLGRMVVEEADGGDDDIKSGAMGILL